jgi:hypothetical protein
LYRPPLQCTPAKGAFTATGMSSGGRYKAVVTSANLRLNQATSLDIRLSRVDGQPLLATTSIRLRLLMIAHGHGMTTQPVLKPMGPGHVVADGILLHMPGEWTLFVDVAEGPVTEKIEICTLA